MSEKLHDLFKILFFVLAALRDHLQTSFPQDSVSINCKCLTHRDPGARKALISVEIQECLEGGLSGPVEQGLPFEAVADNPLIFIEHPHELLDQLTRLESLLYLGVLAVLVARLTQLKLGHQLTSLLSDMVLESLSNLCKGLVLVLVEHIQEGEVLKTVMRDEIFKTRISLEEGLSVLQEHLILEFLQNALLNLIPA